LNNVSIISYDSNSNEINGIFDVLLIVDSTFKEITPSLIDTLHFENGEFHTIVYRY
jgi:hypothetical protein